MLNEKLESLGKEEECECVEGYEEFGLTQPCCPRGVFENSALTHVQLPSNLRKLEKGTFQNCAKLRSVKLPDGLEIIGEAAFRGAGLWEIKIP